MTYRAAECPACASTSWKTYSAVVAPFVAEYAIGAQPAPTRLVECKDCGFRFFEDRLTDTEVAKLYDGYRGEGYYRARHRHEPWYTRAANDSSGDIPARRATIERFAKPRVKHVGDLLDFGGDRGQFIPAGLAERSFVYEISGVPAVPGVELVATEKDLDGRAFDLVLLCHVLEHASEPRALLSRIRPLLRDGGALYVEVPFERPNLRWLGRGTRWLSALRKVPPLLKAVDLYSTAFRHKLGFVPPLGLVKLHEHINFFDERSLRAMLEASGFADVTVGLENLDPTKGLPPVVCALARTS